jgi:type II secretory pathway component PulC
MNLRRMLCLVIFVTVFLFFSWSDETRAETPGKTRLKDENQTENQTVSGSQKEPASIESYIFISEKNLFHPERKDFPISIQPSPQEVNKPVVRPQITLYGVTIAEDYQSASVVIAGRPLKKGEREIIGLKVGEMVGEYKLTKILSDRIVLDETGDSFEVLLYDSKMSKRRSDMKTDNRPVTVTNPLTPPAEGSKPVQVQTATKEAPIGIPEPTREMERALSRVTMPTQSQTPGESPMVSTPVPPESLGTSSAVTPPTAPTPTPGQPVRRLPRGIPYPVELQNYGTPGKTN